MTAADHAALTALNRDYVAAVQHSDVKRFQEILAVDFRCSTPDATLLDKAQFLAVTAKPVTVTGLEPVDVEIRLLGDIAIIHAATRYKTADGTARQGRYTDIWARRGGTWLCIAAHVTRG